MERQSWQKGTAASTRDFMTVEENKPRGRGGPQGAGV
jgi:hypothetical protein